MSATTARELPTGDGWIGEPKYDGIRLLARVENGRAHLITRNGKELTAEFPAIAAELENLAKGRTLLLDGEVVAMRGGRPARFQMLQRRRLEGGGGKNSFAVFDLLIEGKKDRMREPWSERRAALESLLKHTNSPHLLLSSYSKDVPALLARARKRGAEGIIAKRTDAPYEPGKRSRSWLKLKLEHEQEFVIGGWTPPQRSRPFLGAILVGYYADEELSLRTPTTISDLRPCRLRRLFAIQARHGARPRNGASHDPVLPTERGRGLVLRGRVDAGA